MALTPPTPPALSAASASESIYSSPADQSLRPARQVPRDSQRSHSVYIGDGVLTAAAGAPGPADQHAGSHLTAASHHYLKVCCDHEGRRSPRRIDAQPLPDDAGTLIEAELFMEKANEQARLARGRRGHFHAPVYISFVILHRKQKSWGGWGGGGMKMTRPPMARHGASCTRTWRCAPRLAITIPVL
jgi:hypothetical protein